jgi:pyruvate/2-oxoglutarate dehydrogenase complex dihydrolipoamide dehydrogenase (E3) component
MSDLNDLAPLQEPPEDVDLLVIGGGKAGKSLAMDLAKAGQHVAMVERAMIGGTCINVACIPTKTIIHSGRVLSSVRRSEEFGIEGAVAPRMNVDLLRHRKEDVVGTMVKGQQKAFTDSGMDFIMGEARFIEPRIVLVTLEDGSRRMLRGRDVVLNLGTVPLLPPIDGLADVDPHTSETLLHLDSLPESIIVLGGGYVGCEFADLLNTIGVEVTIVQGGSQLLAREDPDIAETLQQRFTDAGIKLVLNSRAERVARDADGNVTVWLSGGDSVTAEELLVAVGRQPVTDGINLEGAGVELTDRGFITVDDQLRTTADDVWAAGDVAGSPQFTHASYDDYRVLKTNLAAKHADGHPRSTKGRLVPYTVFTTPELARVGLSETEARAAGHNVRIARMPVSAIPRARTIGQLDGVWKAVVDRDTNHILGVALMSAEASEVVSVVQMAMLAGMEYTEVRDAIITHPTMAEGLTLLFTPTYLED